MYSKNEKSTIYYLYHYLFLSFKVYLPFIFRYTTEKYTSVRMVERKLLNRFVTTQNTNIKEIKKTFFISGFFKFFLRRSTLAHVLGHIISQVNITQRFNINMTCTPLQILSQNCWTKSTWSTQTAAMGRRRSHRRTWWSGWKMPKSFTSSSTSVTRSWSSRNPTLVTDADSSGGCRFQFICCHQIIRSHSHHSGLVMLITSLFQDQRGVSGAVHCERGNQVCSALLFWGRDWASQVEVWSGGWVSVFLLLPACDAHQSCDAGQFNQPYCEHCISTSPQYHSPFQVGSGLPEVLLQGSGDQERTLCQRCLQGE